MEKLTRLDYYENICSLLIQSNLVDPSMIPNKTFYSNKIDYLNGLVRVIISKYDIIKNMSDSDIGKYRLKNNINKDNIMNFLDNEFDMSVHSIFYNNLSDDAEKQTLFRRILSVLSTDKPYTVTEIMKDNSYYFEDFSNQKVSALMLILKRKKLVEDMQVNKRTLFVKSKKLDYIFKIMKDNYVALSSDIEQFIELSKRKTSRLDENIIENNIKSNKQSLIEYIQSLISIETDIISLKKRYSILQKDLFENILKNFEEYSEIEDVVVNSKKELLNNIKELERKIQDKPELTFSIILERPKKPSKPHFNVIEPELPIYLKSNIFNKKKIELENEKLRLNYELELKEYQSKLEEYKEKQKKYERDIIKYKEEVLLCEERELKLNKEKYEDDLKKYNTEKEKILIELEKEREKLDCLDKNYVEEKEKVFIKNDKYNELKSIIYEMDYIKTIIEKNIELENKLYSKGVIYIKYREYVSLTRFYDYLLSGRCDSLDGAMGAYNLYEQEIRSDVIISKLDKIELSLEDIKNNQVHIYNELVKINNSLDLINGQLLVNNILQAVQIEQLDKIIDNTDKIAYNTQVTAYYAEKMARYQKNMLLLTLFNK